MDDGKVLKLTKDLYGIRKSGLNWYLTYLYHHVYPIWRNCSVVDPSVMYRMRNDEMEGTISFQVDYLFIIGAAYPLRLLEEYSTHFKHQPLLSLEIDHVRLNGFQV